jgi:hypothetical protein
LQDLQGRSVVREHDMPDKAPHQHETKKSMKSIKEKRAVKRAKHESDAAVDPVAHLRMRKK